MSSPIILAGAPVTAAARGAKILLIGPTGVGKTSLLRTVDLKTTLFVDVEAGDLAVQDLSVDTLRPRTWPQCRDLAVALAGANPAVPADSCYSAAHYASVQNPFEKQLSEYSTFFVDSITAAGRLCFAWSGQQAEAFSDRSGKRDLRGTYGLHAREMIAWLMHLQQARSINVVFVGVLETVVDDFNRVEHRLQLEGARTGRELPAVVDEVITYNWIDFGDGLLTRSFICIAPNRWGYPAKDRSGRLDQIEEPHLGKLISKLTRPSAAASHDPQPPQVKPQGEVKHDVV
jgi:AAA domain